MVVKRRFLVESQNSETYPQVILLPPKKKEERRKKTTLLKLELEKNNLFLFSFSLLKMQLFLFLPSAILISLLCINEFNLLLPSEHLNFTLQSCSEYPASLDYRTVNIDQPISCFHENQHCSLRYYPYRENPSLFYLEGRCQNDKIFSTWQPYSYFLIPPIILRCYIYLFIGGFILWSAITCFFHSL
jgi:hypothetical protein